MIIYAATNGYLDDVDLDIVANWEQAFYRYMDANHPEIGQEIVEKSVKARDKMSDDLLKRLGDAINEFKQTAAPRPEQKPVTAGQSEMKQAEVQQNQNAASPQ
jgi:F-type H+-transporting ATPase subunit alpha